jgi:uncharacterized damage-inducible protein DinB
MNPQSTAALLELFEYNYWARDRQLQVCATLTAEQFVRPLGNSFPSVRDTLVHLAAVEWLWLERWRGRSPRALPKPDEFPALDAVTQYWQTVERQMRAFVGDLTDEALASDMTCVSTRGQAWTFPLWRMIEHLLHHQSYHRGQVTALFRQLGVQPPKVDFLDAHGMNFQL